MSGRPEQRSSLVEHGDDLAQRTVAAFCGDAEHPDWADYVATNLLDALSRVPDTGDWHGAVRSWCAQTMTGNLKPNSWGV